MQERDGMEYKVVNPFEDLQDGRHKYQPGDTFPRDGLKVSRKRLAELSSEKNKQNRPLIEAVFGQVDTKPEKESRGTLPFEPKTYTKSEIMHLSTAELKNLAAEVGIEDAFEKPGTELKKLLIEFYGL